MTDAPPAHQDASAPGTSPSSQASPLPEGQANFTVLVVEGNSFFRDLLQDALHLRLPSLKLSTAATVADALVQIDAIRPDLIFMDVRLADADGFEMTRRVQQAADKASVILFTGIDFPEHRGEARRSCADHCRGNELATDSDIIRLVESAVASCAAR